MCVRPVTLKEELKYSKCNNNHKRTFRAKMFPSIIPIIVGTLLALTNYGEAKKFVESDVYSSSGELLSVFRLEQEMVSS